MPNKGRCRGRHAEPVRAADHLKWMQHEATKATKAHEGVGPRPHVIRREGKADETIATLDPSAAPQSLRASSCSSWLRAASTQTQPRPESSPGPRVRL